MLSGTTDVLTGFNHSGFAAIVAMTIAQPHREHHSIRWGPQGCQPAREVRHRARSNHRHMARGPARGKRPALLLVPACVLREIFVLRLACLSLRGPRIVTYSPSIVHMMKVQSPAMPLPLHFRDRGHGRRYGHHLGLTWDRRTSSLMPALMLPRVWPPRNHAGTTHLRHVRHFAGSVAAGTYRARNEAHGSEKETAATQESGRRRRDGGVEFGGFARRANRRNRQCGQ